MQPRAEHGAGERPGSRSRRPPRAAAGEGPRSDVGQPAQFHHPRLGRGRRRFGGRPDRQGPRRATTRRHRRVQRGRGGESAAGDSLVTAPRPASGAAARRRGARRRRRRSARGPGRPSRGVARHAGGRRPRPRPGAARSSSRPTMAAANVLVVIGRHDVAADHGLERGARRRRGDHRHAPRHRLEHLVLDAGRVDQRRGQHGGRAPSSPAMSVHVAGDLDAAQAPPGPGAPATDPCRPAPAAPRDAAAQTRGITSTASRRAAASLAW